MFINRLILFSQGSPIAVVFIVIATYRRENLIIFMYFYVFLCIFTSLPCTTTTAAAFAVVDNAIAIIQ
jgi:hypothetical protein